MVERAFSSSKWDNLDTGSDSDTDAGGLPVPLEQLTIGGADLVSALLGQLGIVDLEQAAPPSAAKSSVPARQLDDLSASESKADDMLDVKSLGAAGTAAAPLLVRHLPPLRELAARDPTELFSRAGSDEAAQRLFTRLARVLNDGADGEGAELDGAAKAAVLETLGDAARERRKRHLVLGALGELSESFEALLRDHEAGRRKYGRKVGALHSLMLVALCRVLDYNMGAADLLELVSGDAALAMELVVSVAKGAAYEDLLFVALCRLLCGLTQPETYVQASGLGDNPGSTTAAAAVAKRMSTLVKHAMSANIVAQMSECLANRFGVAAFSMSAAAAAPAPEEEAVSPAASAVVSTMEHLATVALLGAVHNVYLFAADGAAATEYRQHLLAVTPVCSSVVLPYLAKCFVLPLQHQSTTSAAEAARALRAPPTLNEDPLLRAGVLVALKVGVTASFRLNTKHVAATEFATSGAWLSEAMLEGRGGFWRCSAHVELLSLLLLLNTNLGSFVPPTVAAGALTPLLGSVRRTLEPLAASAHAAGSGEEADRGASTMRERRREQLCALADSVEGIDGGVLPVVRDSVGYRALKDLLLSMLGNGDSAAADGAKAVGKDTDVGAETGASAPSVAEAKALGVSSSTPLAKVEAKPARAVAAQATGGLLDDLPQLGSPLCLPRRSSSVAGDDAAGAAPLDDERQARRERRRKRQAAKAARKREKEQARGAGAASAATVDGAEATTVPERFCCAINGHVMKAPVRSPFGHTFERATIEQWLLRQGSVCPFTGNELQKKQLERAEDLENEIAVFHVRRAVASASKLNAVGSGGGAAGGTDDDDLYDF